jgi:hypothetical protein
LRAPDDDTQTRLSALDSEGEGTRLEAERLRQQVGTLPRRGSRTHHVTSRHITFTLLLYPSSQLADAELKHKALASAATVAPATLDELHRQLEVLVHRKKVLEEQARIDLEVIQVRLTSAFVVIEGL